MPRRAPSVASSCTLRAPSVGQAEGFWRVANGGSEDVEMMDVDSEPTGTSPCPRRKFYIAVDYGTTNSAVSFVALNPGENPEEVNPDRIRSISNYPKDPRRSNRAAKEVPTELCYLSTPQQQQSLHSSGQGARPNHPLLDDSDLDDDGADANTSQNGVSTVPTFSKNLHWGYEVQDMLGQPNETSLLQLEKGCVKRAKLMLDESEHTEDTRKNLKQKFKYLTKMKRVKGRKRVKAQEDFIVHFLTRLFLHVKEELEADYGYTDRCAAEFILCVPPLWTFKASQRMHDSMLVALRESNFIPRVSKSVDNLFIVSEPEAAAAYILTTSKDNHNIRPGDTFVLLDAGGGTVDAITYSVKGRARQVRLKAEEVMGDGGLCGSAFLNERFRAHVKKRLQGETYLNTATNSIDQIIESDHVMEKFEHREKRRFCLRTAAKEPFQMEQIYFIPGLRENPEQRLDNGLLTLSVEDVSNIFLPPLEDVASLMESQLDRARVVENGALIVDKVILIGGFAESPALRQYLQKKLRRIKRTYNTEVELIEPNENHNLGIAVASGAVLRALDKRNGPERKMRASYGILCREMYDPDLAGHQAASSKLERDVDGHDYVSDSLVWLIKRGQTLAGDPKECEFRIPMLKTIKFEGEDVIETDFFCKQTLYVSDVSTESHYRRDHVKNKDKHEKVAVIPADMGFLKRRNEIRPVRGGPNRRGPQHYKVEFEVVLQVMDRNLYYKAVYPIGSDNVIPGSQGWTNIAAALPPGAS